MLIQLPIRLSFFIRCGWNVVLAYLAGIGALAIYNGHADIISWYMLGAFVVGSVLGEWMRQSGPTLSKAA